MVDHQYEFVTAVAGNGVALTKTRLQPSGNRLQHLIAKIVAKTVVDELETVQIDERHCDPVVVAFGAHQSLIQAVLQAMAIGQTGQCIKIRLVFQSCFVLLLLRNIFQRVFQSKNLLAFFAAHHQRINPAIAQGFQRFPGFLQLRAQQFHLGRTIIGRRIGRLCWMLAHDGSPVHLLAMPTMCRVPPATNVSAGRFNAASTRSVLDKSPMTFTTGMGTCRTRVGIAKI